MRSLITTIVLIIIMMVLTMTIHFGRMIIIIFAITTILPMIMTNTHQIVDTIATITIIMSLHIIIEINSRFLILMLRMNIKTLIIKVILIRVATINSGIEGTMIEITIIGVIIIGTDKCKTALTLKKNDIQKTLHPTIPRVGLQKELLATMSMDLSKVQIIAGHMIGLEADSIQAITTLTTIIVITIIVVIITVVIIAITTNITKVDIIAIIMDMEDIITTIIGIIIMATTIII